MQRGAERERRGRGRRSVSICPRIQRFLRFSLSPFLAVRPSLPLSLLRTHARPLLLRNAPFSQRENARESRHTAQRRRLEGRGIPRLVFKREKGEMEHGNPRMQHARSWRARGSAAKRLGGGRRARSSKRDERRHRREGLGTLKDQLDHVIKNHVQSARRTHQLTRSSVMRGWAGHAGGDAGCRCAVMPQDGPRGDATTRGGVRARSRSGHVRCAAGNGAATERTPCPREKAGPRHPHASDGRDAGHITHANQRKTQMHPKNTRARAGRLAASWIRPVPFISSSKLHADLHP